MSYDLEDVKELISSGEAVLFDVREQEEWDAGHLAGATLISLSQIDAGNIPDDLEKSKQAYTYCMAGRRSVMAADLLKARGFNNVKALYEGIDELVAKGFEKN